MADLAKNVPVVSSSPKSSSSPPACKLTDDPTSPNGADDLSFTLPDTDDGTSLQDLIDSELALRISVDVPDDDTESEEPIPFSGRKQDVQHGNYDLSLDEPRSEERAVVHPVVNGKKAVDLGDEVEDIPEDDPLVPVSNGVEKAVSPTDKLIMDLNSPDSEVSDGGVDINTKFILSEQGHGVGDLTEADILFFNTFNQVQSNGDEFLSSPEVENPPVQSPIVVDNPILTGFDPFATIPSQDLESPVFEAQKPFPTNDRNASSPDESREDVSPPSCVEDNFFVTNDKDVVVGNNELLDNRSPTNTVDSPADINNCMDVNNADNDLICIEEPEICSENEGLFIETSEVEENGPGAMDTLISVEDTNLLTPELINIPMIGVTPPEEGTEYDEDAYYAQLESQLPIETTQTEQVFAEKEEETKVSPVEESRENLDSWTALEDVDFNQMEESEIEVVEMEPESELNQSQAEEIATDQSQTSNIIEPVEHAFVDQPAVCINKPESDSESSEAVTSSSSTEKKSKKKKSGDGGETKTKRNKKNKEGKENISVKSSFSKFDALQKKTVLHVRSVDASKVQKQFNQSAPTEVSSNCKVCGKQVFQMEQVKAERSVYHKNCFRCLQCSKQLTVDTYSSHEGQVYCKPHFKELFQPKVVIEDDAEPVRRRKPEIIIRENQPMELPPGVIRASDKPDLGLEELGSLNVKSRFQVFEKTEDSENTIDKSPSAVNVKRSPSILSKLARFQAKGMDVGVTDDSLNGIPLEESSSSEEEEEEEEEGGDGKEVVRANRKQRERPVSFGKMEDIKGRWESGTTVSKEERRQERKQEIQSIRSRLFMGHQGKMKEMYQQAVSESTNVTSAKKEDMDVCTERATKSIKERFERGEPLNADDEDVQGKKPMDEDLVDAGYSKKSRSLFLELDATAAKQTPISPPKSTISRNESFKKPTHDIIFNRTPSQDVVKASDQLEDVVVETADIGNKFKFFETYKPSEKEKKKFRITPPREGTVKEKTPEREIYRDPTIVRSDDRAEESEITRSQTASKMLSFFKHMEQSANKEEIPQGPKPLKRFTPPPDSEMNREDESSEDEESSEEEEEEEEDEHDPNIIRSSDKQEDEFLKQAATAARAKALRAKFERWEEKEIEREKEAATLNGSATEQGDSADQTSLDTTRSLRARFESMNSEKSPVKDKQARPKVNRFVEIQTTCAEFCASCEKKVYHLERVETGKKVFHKNCFRCLQCNCILRMDTYTLNSGKLYCIPHFKQIFFAKGNYEEGFGIDQHKRKWASNQSNDILLELTTAEH